MGSAVGAVQWFEWYSIVLCLLLCVRTYNTDAAGEGEAGDHIELVSRVS